MGTVLLGNLDGVLPHIVVLGIQFRFAVGDGIGRQADGGDHVAHFEHQRVIVLLLAGIVFIHGDIPLFLHVPDELLFIPFSLGQEDKSGENACVVTLILGLCLGPLCDLFLALLNHRRGILVFGVQFCPPPGVGNGLFLLTIEILIAVGHPHIPLRLVLAFLPDGLQYLNGAAQGLVSLIVRSTLVVVPDDGVILQRPRHGVGNAIVPPVLRDGVEGLDAAGVLVLVVPLLQLLEVFFFVLRGVRDIIHARQRLVQLGGLILIVRFLLGRCF